ncbi:hypothetical protein C8F04DRAFT_1086655 [Mycena alexandri]|uniref:Uncharacterized protein n=1 Tax=Mycena alexandri TaxID=1745969 RepID=A0AAD6T540_9AGAR|nr:hypothetical protein C8F04DRAFT_1086655 [Mycena alexandri]
MLDRRVAPRVDAGKRTRSQVEKEDADSELEALGLQYPLSPVSPPQLPTQSPPPRLLSPFVLAARRSPTYTPDPEDRTAFDLTIACDSLPRPSKKRRVSDSSEATLVGTPGCGTQSEETIVTKTQERETCVPAGLGECDMDLESESESESDSDSEAAISSGSRSRSVSRATSASPPATSSSPFTAATSSVEQRPTPPPSASLAKAHLRLEYVDIMYVPTDGKLVCRVCLLAAPNAAGGTRRGPIQAFLPSASWDALRSHCEEAHPEACRDVVGLGQAGVQELRRRLGLGRGA